MNTENVTAAKEQGKVAVELNVRTSLPSFPYKRYERAARLSADQAAALIKYYEAIIAEDAEGVEKP